MWKGLAATFRTEWLQNRAAQRERARGQDGGPNYYIVRRHRLGAALLNFVARNMSEGVLTDRKRVVTGKRVSVSVDLGGRRIINKKNRTNNTCQHDIRTYKYKNIN